MSDCYTTRLPVHTGSECQTARPAEVEVQEPNLTRQTQTEGDLKSTLSKEPYVAKLETSMTATHLHIKQQAMLASF